VRILTIVQGVYGRRIAAHIEQRSVPGWLLTTWELPTVLPPVIDYPEEFLPTHLPPADLLLALGEHPGVAELLPDIARLCGAFAAIVPVDNVAWLPPGLMRQLAGWLAAQGVAAVFPKPFCSLTETHYNAYRRQIAYDVPLVAEFARYFGKPVYTVALDETTHTIAQVDVLRDTPCGCAHHVAAGLTGVHVDEAGYATGMLHHHFPCLAGMVIDPDYADTLMHVSGRILQDEVDRHIRPARTPPRYLRPTGRSE
jgi:hypothetical protein